MGSLGTDNTRDFSSCAKPKKDKVALSCQSHPGEENVEEFHLGSSSGPSPRGWGEHWITERGREFGFFLPETTIFALEF
jgi:hypothetical protein